MACIQNVLIKTIPEETRRHSWRQDVLIAKI